MKLYVYNLAFDDFYKDSKRTQIVLTNIFEEFLLFAFKKKKRTLMIEGQIRLDFINWCW